MKDTAEFRAELARPLPGEVGPKVTEAELDEDARSFMAFAAAMGIQPPKPKAIAAAPDPLPSPSST